MERQEATSSSTLDGPPEAGPPLSVHFRGAMELLVELHRVGKATDEGTQSVPGLMKELFPEGLPFPLEVLVVFVLVHNELVEVICSGHLVSCERR